MKILKEVPQERCYDIAKHHVVVGAALPDKNNTLTPIASSIRENLLDCVIHILEKNTDGSVHNGKIFQAADNVFYFFVDDINLLEKVIQEDLKTIPDIAGVYFTKAKSQFTALFD